MFVKPGSMLNQLLKRNVRLALPTQPVVHWLMGRSNLFVQPDFSRPENHVLPKLQLQMDFSSMPQPASLLVAMLNAPNAQMLQPPVAQNAQQLELIGRLLLLKVLKELVNILRPDGLKMEPVTILAPQTMQQILIKPNVLKLNRETQPPSQLFLF